MAVALTYEPIATQTLGSAAASVTFSSISGAYTDLVLVGSLNTTAALDYWFRLNGDTGTNHSNTRMTGNGTSGTSSRGSGSSQTYINSIANATGQHQFTINLLNYSNTTTYKTQLTRFANAGMDSNARVSLWRSTSAITTILIQTDSSTFTAGSTFTLYGIAAA